VTPLIRAVFDTNVLVSSLIRKGKPRELWDQAVEGRIQLFISDALVDEFLAVIAGPHIARYSDRHTALRFARVLVQIAKAVEPRRLPQVTEDPDDNIVFEAAVACRAGYIVTGDRHLLGLGKFRSARIVRVGEMLTIV